MWLKNCGFAQDSMHSTMFGMAFKSPNGYAEKKWFAKKKVLVAIGKK